MYYKGYPDFVFELWALGAGDTYCAADMDLPIHPARRLFWRIRGAVLEFLFGWWWWVKVETRPTPVAADLGEERCPRCEHVTDHGHCPQCNKVYAPSR